MPLEATTWLDPCELGNAAPGTVGIPATQIRGRVFELPPPGVEVNLVAGPDADTAAEVLRVLGRTSRVGAPPLSGPGRPRLWRPSVEVEHFAAESSPRMALDLGCGSGRDAVHLADLGWHVVAVDRLPDALEQGRRLERTYAEATSIDWRCEDAGAVRQRFGLVVCVQGPWRSVWQHLHELVEVGGHVLVEGFEDGPNRAPLSSEVPAGFVIERHATGRVHRGATRRLVLRRS